MSYGAAVTDAAIPAAPQPDPLAAPGVRRAVLTVAGLNAAYGVLAAAVAVAIGSVSLLADSADFGEDAAINVLIFIVIIIGGLGSISGAFFGAAFMVLLPLLLNYVPHWLGLPLSTATATYLEHMIFGALIVFFLIVEPHGLARLWRLAKDKLRLWPFPH